MAALSKETCNILWLSFTMMILFTAVLSHEFIMEPLLHAYAKNGWGGIQDKDGYLALCIIYAFNTIGCFISPWLVSKISGKWAMALGVLTVMLYEAVYIVPNRFLILLVSCFVGIGTTFLWVGQGQYISESVNDKTRELTTSVQWAFFKMSLIFGGVFFFFYFKESPIEDIVTDGKVPVFMGIFMGCAALSVLNICAIPQTKMSQQRQPEPFLRASANFFKLLRKAKIICLAIFFFYTGISRSFWISIFPACIKFSSRLSTNTTASLTLAMITTGVGQVLGSTTVASLGRKTRNWHKGSLIIGALVMHTLLFVLIGISFPNDAPLGHTDKDGPILPLSVPLALFISFLLGFGDAVLQTQVYAYIAKYYQKSSGSLFSVFRAFAGIASTIMFFLAQYIPLGGHLSILFLTAAAAGAAVLSFHRINDAYEVATVQVIPSPRAGGTPNTPKLKNTVAPLGNVQF